MSLFNDEQQEELKALFGELTGDGMDPNDAQKKAAEEIAKKGEVESAASEMETKLDAMSTQIEEVIKAMQEIPAVKSAGYFTVDGGAADKNVKSFGDYLLAVKRHDVKRLHEVYGSTKDVQLEDGPSGGYLVPEEYHARLMEVAAPMSIVRPRATVIPVATANGRIPSLDQNTAPTAGQGDSAFAGGVVANWVAAGGTLTETQPKFEQIEYTIRKLAGYTEVENEVLADSAIGIEALLTRVFGRTVAAMEDYAFLRGNGVAEPLGVLNAAAAVSVTTVTDNAFAYKDALAMRARFKALGGSGVWAIHPGVWPDIGIFEVSSGSGGVFQANLAAAQNQTILGWPIIESEHLPQDDNAGDVLLADFSAYLILDRNEMSIAYSEHAAFTSDKATWRFVKRLDGQPWLSGAITLADPQGSYTVSPFVYHND